MKVPLAELAERYSLVLREYFEGGGEGALLQAYQLGREAAASGLSVLEMAALHQDALLAALLKMLAPEESARIARRASEVFVESVIPFEMTRRSEREANVLLAEVNRELERKANALLEDYRTTREQLDETQRLQQIKNEIISVVSHELRTPLTSIHGALGLISSLGGDVTPEVRRLLDVAYRNSRRLVRLVDDILDLEKIESGALVFEPRPLELRPLLEQAIEANQAYGLARGVTLSLEGPSESLRLRADPDRLMQVVTNLLSNAAKFSPTGEKVVLSAARRGGCVRISVSDRGAGIPEEFRDRIFQRFAQADSPGTRERGGSGLGLSISKAIVERMGGSIAFDSRIGEGTTFHLDLPECVEARPASSA